MITILNIKVMKRLLLLALLCSLSINAQKLQIGKVYNIDNNPYSDNPFERKEFEIIKIIDMKNGYVKYRIVKAWCCKGQYFSQRQDVLIDQIKSYNKKFKKH